MGDLLDLYRFCGLFVLVQNSDFRFQTIPESTCRPIIRHCHGGHQPFLAKVKNAFGRIAIFSL